MTELAVSFPPDFVWGVATASYQIEGAAASGGRGVGNWDVFAQRPGAIFRGQDANSACDHYHLWEQDLDLLAELGVDAYRFGLSWSRIFPDGLGRSNEEGLAFYDRLIDGLLARGITPYATLFHWDMPQALEDRGGFRNGESPAWFEGFTQSVARRYGDRVRHWFTLNEPHAFIEGGLRHGRHAPGYQLPLSEVLLAGHHALLAHGRSVQVLRSSVPESWVAMAPVLICGVPLTESAADVEAARQFTFAMRDDGLRATSWWMDPVYGLGYPEDGLRRMGRAMCAFTDADLDIISQPLDACGFNLYDAAVVTADQEGRPIGCPFRPGAPHTAFDWPVTPNAHRYGPLFAYERYRLPTMVTENGLSTRDWKDRNGEVIDLDRVDFIARHLQELSLSRREARVLGYFHWSLLDNFEWNHGYRERFGLVHVDYATSERTKKRSFGFYRGLIDACRAGHPVCIP